MYFGQILKKNGLVYGSVEQDKPKRMETRVLIPPSFALCAKTGDNDRSQSQIFRFLEQDVVIVAKDNLPAGLTFHPILGCTLRAGDIKVFSILDKNNVSCFSFLG